jgi:transglutaminase-like putative cysteine protease
MKHVLFFTRLLLYLAVVAIPFFHPAILVPYDLSGIGQWFVIVPGMFLIAFYFSPPLMKIRFWLIIAGAFLIISSLIFGGFTLDTLGLLAAGALAFILTVLVFKTQGKGRVVAALELCFTGVLYVAFLSFSRSSQEIAQASSGILKLLFVAAVVTFFLHAAVLFIASFPQIFKGRGKRNLVVFMGVLAPIALVLALLLPVSFIVNDVRLNPLGPELDRQLDPADGFDRSPQDENGNQLNKLKNDRNGKLEGMNRDRWNDMNLRRGSGKNQKQVAVMIVATAHNTLYLGSEYFSDLDSQRGLLHTQDEPLNDLAALRLIETWQNTTMVKDEGREDVSADIFSSLPERYFAYRPLSFTPTVMDKELRPFVYGYEGHFDVSTAPEEDLLKGDRALTAEEKAGLSRFLDVPFEPATAAAFKSYLSPLLKPGMKNYEKILAIMNGFHSFQYELGFDERVNTAKILNFVLIDKTGDCTEFSNATAMLARLAGVPSRVVTGYLASQDLMLPKHRQGLAYLRSRMPVLQKYDPSQLIMVTTSHRHSWAQVYVAPFGWIDVEATGYAKPPKMGGDANQWTLVVPRMEKGTEESGALPFPWLTVLEAVLIGSHGVLFLIYLIKYLRLMIIAAAAKRNTRLGLRALQRLLLLRLSDRGYAWKPPSVTIFEYSEKYAGLAGFAAHYTELRYREEWSDEERSRAWQDLRSEYARIMREEKQKGRGPGRWFFRLVSLKGFRY